MKRMWSRNELKKIIKTLVESSEWSFEGDVVFGGNATFNDDVEIDGDLSIDGAFSVTGAINGEANPSVKPIYWHGIEFANTNDASAMVYGHILNNNSEQFNTFQKFIDWITSITSSVYFQCHGVIQYNNNLTNILAIYKRANENTINFVVETATGYAVISNVTLSSYFNSVSDGVNKIN